MATVREIRARFTAEVAGLQNAFRTVQREASGLGPSVQRSTEQANRAYSKLGDNAKNLQRVLAGAAGGDTFDALNQAAQTARREIENTGRISARTMQDLEREAQNAGQQLGQMGGDARRSMGDIEDAINNVVGDMSRLQSGAGDASRAVNNLGDRNNLNNLSGDLNNAQDGLNDVRTGANRAGDAVDSASGDLRDFGDTAARETDNAGGAFGKLGGIAGKMAGVLGAVFAVDAIKDFAVNIVETTADIEALNGQYEQVMGGMKDSTDKYLNQMADKWNKHPNELKSAYMQYVALLKGKGASEEEAHDLAKKYMDMTVDGNAFANEAMADTVSRFTGMIKGEYDSVDTAMVNLTATQLDKLAKAEFGKPFQELNTAEQELLKTNEALMQQDVAGVIGQGAREADSYNNNVAMLKETWKEFIAEYGGPVLKFANERLKNAIGFVRGLGDNIEWVADKLEPLRRGFGALMDVLSGEDETAQNIFAAWGLGGNFWDPIIDGVEKVRTIVGALRDVLSGEDETVSNIFAAWGLGPDTWGGVTDGIETVRTAVRDVKANAIPMLQDIARFIKQALVDSWPAVKNAFSLAITFIGEYIGLLRTLWDENGRHIAAKVKEILIDVWPYVKKAIGAAVEFIGKTIRKILDFWNSDGKQFFDAVKNVFDGIMKVVDFVMPYIFMLIKSIWGNIKGVITGALDIIMGAVKIFSGLFTGDFSKMWEGVKQLFGGAIKFLWNAIQLSFYGKILGGAKIFVLGFKGFFIELWKSITLLFKGNISGAILTFKNGWAAVSKSTTDTFSAIWKYLKDLWTALSKMFTGSISFISKTFSNGWSGIRTATTNSFNKIYDFLKGLIGTIKSFFSTRLSEMVTNFKTQWTNAYNLTKTIFTNVKNFLSGLFSDVAKGIAVKATNIYNSLKDNWNKVLSKTKDIFGSMKKSVNDSIDNIVDAAKKMPGRMADGIKSMKYKLEAGIKSLGNSVIGKAETSINGLITGVNWVLKMLTSNTRIDPLKIDRLAHGTDDHPGGPAVLGDGRGDNAGRELVQLPDGNAFLSEPRDTLYNLPKGSKVLSAKKTRDFMANMPKYANGIGNWLTNAKDAAGDLWGSVKGKAKAVGSKVANSISNNLKALKGVTESMFFDDWAKSPSDLLTQTIKKMWMSRNMIDMEPGTSFFGGRGMIENTVPQELVKGGFAALRQKAVDLISKNFPKMGKQPEGYPNFGSNFFRNKGFGVEYRGGNYIGNKLVQASHNGIDFGSKIGTAIKAQAAGRVTRSQAFGGQIDTENGAYQHIYAHMSELYKNVGDWVKKGETIGRVGTSTVWVENPVTGRTERSTPDNPGQTYPHVHYSVKKNGKYIDPYSLGKSPNLREWIAEKAKSAAGAVGEYMGKGGKLGKMTFDSIYRRTSKFGMRFHPILGYSRLHAGVDLAAPVGTPIKAQADGRVGVSAWHSGRGNYVTVKSADGVELLYQHNSRNLVAPGQNVKKGQTIALVGSTGLSSGPHLHLEMRKNGKLLNPNALAGFENGGIASGKLGAQLAWLTEGGFAESIISHDPSKRPQQQQIWERTGDMLGFNQTAGADQGAILAILLRIAKAVEMGHNLIMDETLVAQILKDPLKRLQAIDDEISTIYKK